MNHGHAELDASVLLRQVAERVPPALRANVIVIGSIATAWAFRDVSGTNSVATKDIDLLLRPAVNAVATGETLGQKLLNDGWQPRFPNDIKPGTPDTSDDRLPALRLSPPGGEDEWFVELLAEPLRNQVDRKYWRRLQTKQGTFGLPSFRYMELAVHNAVETEFGLRVARPANMALAHLLEHAEPDTTPIANLPGEPPRFTKDVGRAVSLWWLAGEQSTPAGARDRWLAELRETLGALYPGAVADIKSAASRGIASIAAYLQEAHAIAVTGVLAPHGTTLDAFRRAHGALSELIEQL